MKIPSPFRSPGSSSNDSGPRNQPKMRDFGSSLSNRNVAVHRRRPNRRSSLYDTEDTSNYTSPSEQYSSLTETIASTSQYKVSEIVNPDGTVTVRNLVINADGNWECQQEERDYHQPQTFERPSSRSSASKSYSTLHSQINSAAYSSSYSTMESEIAPPVISKKRSSDKLPELTAAASFDSTRSTTSSESSKVGKFRSDVSELSEGGAHQLRRQRLAKTMTIAQKYGIPESPPLPSYTVFQDVEQQRSPSSPRSTASSESSQMMLLLRTPVEARTSTPPTPQTPRMRTPDSPPRTKRTATLLTDKNRMRHSSSRSKHVAFLEPNSSHEESKDGDHYPVYLGQKYSYIARDDQDDDSSVFRDVVTPSPEGNGKIDEILGPPPAPTFLVPNASDGNDEASASKNSKSKCSSGSGGSRKQNGESTRMPREEPPVKMTATKYHANDMEDTSEGKDDTPEVLTVTVHKVSQGEKIGIFVGLKKFSYGKRLVVSRVAPDGKFANSGVEAGDIVVSINGKNMLEKPSSQEAFDIVLAATDRVTFVVQKQGINDDSRSISGSTISSISRDFGYASTPERSGAKAGTQTSCTDEILEKKMAPDGSMILSKETDISEPVVIKANESWKLSGALAVAVKLTSANQNPGIQIGTRETSIGRVLYVSEISQTSPFAQTPLRVGDILLSINDIDLEENADVVGAYSALGNSKDEISIVARKAAESLNEFLYERKELTKTFCERKAVRSTQANLVNNSPDKSQRSSSTSGSRRTKPVERTESDQQKNKETSIVKPQTKSDPGNDSFEFDEESYGASLNGYNSSKQIKIVKSHPHESVGLDLEPIETDWGKLLTVANILPNSKAAKTPIKVGDAILAINGVDLRDSPDVEAAFSVIKRARSEVIVDIQQLSLYPIEVSSADSKPQDNITILAHDTVGVVRTRTFDSNDDFIAQTGTLKIAGRLDNTSVSGDWTENAPEIDANREAPVIPASSLADGGSPTPNPPKKHRKVWVTIRKEYPSEKVGITFAALEKRLIVTNVSPSGLLRGTPVLPGDTILSINGADFSVDPDARYAFELVCMAPEEVLLEVLKTGYAIDAKNHDSKSCLRRPFGCGQKKTQEYAVRLERYPKDDDGETLSTSLADPVQF